MRLVLLPALLALLAFAACRPPAANDAAHASASAEDFANQVAAGGVVLVDFYADWCPPCKELKPIVDQLAKDYEGRIEVLAIDVDAHQELAAKYRIESIPTIIVFKDGEVKERIVGYNPAKVYRTVLDKLAPKG